MILRRPHFRLPWIALAAIAGLVSMTATASASTTNDGGRACCVRRVCTVCCCDPTALSARASQADRTVAPHRAGAGLTIPAMPCECRSGEPAAPASRDESRPVEEPSEGGLSEPFHLGWIAPPAVPHVRLLPPNASLAKSPLYLRTARLLI